MSTSHRAVLFQGLIAGQKLDEILAAHPELTHWEALQLLHLAQVALTAGLEPVGNELLNDFDDVPAALPRSLTDDEYAVFLAGGGSMELALFARAAGVLGSSSAASKWFLRPCDALGCERPVDAVRRPGGRRRTEDELSRIEHGNTR